VEGAGEEYHRGDVKQPHRGGAAGRGVAQVGAADVAGLVCITLIICCLCRGFAARAVGDVHFIVIRIGALAYDNSLAVLSFDGFSADESRRAVGACVAASPYMERSLMICGVHRVVTHGIYIGRAIPAS